jgi:hypothetical protein
MSESDMRGGRFSRVSLRDTRATGNQRRKTSSSKLPAVGSTAGNFLRMSSQILSAFFEQKPASNLIPKRAAVRDFKKTRRLNQRH